MIHSFYTIPNSTDIDLHGYNLEELGAILAKGWDSNGHLLNTVFIHYETDDSLAQYTKIQLGLTNDDLPELVPRSNPIGAVGHSLLHRQVLTKILTRLSTELSDIDSLVLEGEINAGIHLLVKHGFDKDALEALQVQQKLGL